MGARVLALDAFRTDGRRVRLQAGLSAPSRAPVHWLRLLREKAWSGWSWASAQTP